MLSWSDTPTQTVRVDINRSALKNVTPQLLHPVTEAAVKVPVGVIRNPFANAVSQEQKHRTDQQNKQQKNCQSGRADCPWN
jgi:hypothetical protein